MIYTHFITGERYQIYALVGKQCTVREIGAALGPDKVTVSRARLHKMERKIAKAAAKATIKSLRPLAHWVKSVANDHGA